METTKPTKDPRAVIDAAHDALQAAVKEHKDAESLDAAQADMHAPGSRTHAEYTIETRARAERVYIAVLAEHGAKTPIVCDTSTSAALDSWSRENRLRAALEDIADRAMPAARHATYHHARANLDALGTLPTGIAAGVLKAWNSYTHARETASRVQTLRNVQRPPVQWYIDTDRANEDRAEAWSVYRAAPGAPERLEPYAWPGGYVLLYTIETEHETIELCPRCAANEEPLAAVVQQGHQEGPPFICEGCNAIIESDYGDPDAEDEDETESAADRSAD